MIAPIPSSGSARMAETMVPPSGTLVLAEVDFVTILAERVDGRVEITPPEAAETAEPAAIIPEQPKPPTTASPVVEMAPPIATLWASLAVQPLLTPQEHVATKTSPETHQQSPAFHTDAAEDPLISSVQDKPHVLPMTRDVVSTDHFSPMPTALQNDAVPTVPFGAFGQPVNDHRAAVPDAPISHGAPTVDQPRPVAIASIRDDSAVAFVPISALPTPKAQVSDTIRQTIPWSSTIPTAPPVTDKEDTLPQADHEEKNVSNIAETTKSTHQGLPVSALILRPQHGESLSVIRVGPEPIPAQTQAVEPRPTASSSPRLGKAAVITNEPEKLAQLVNDPVPFTKEAVATPTLSGIGSLPKTPETSPTPMPTVRLENVALPHPEAAPLNTMTDPINQDKGVPSLELPPLAPVGSPLPTVTNIAQNVSAAHSTAPAPMPLPPYLAPDIATLAIAGPDGPVTLQLRPEELGTLHFHLTRTAEGTHIHLTVEQPATLDLLRRHADDLLADLQRHGFAGTSLSYSGTGQNSGAEGDPRPPLNDDVEMAPLPSPAFPTAALRSNAVGSLDLRL